MTSRQIKCQNKHLLYNALTKRCYKSCEEKNKVTHPVTKKCRKTCKEDKIRRTSDFRCVKHTLKKKIYNKKIKQAKEKEQLISLPLKKELKTNLKFFYDLLRKGQGKTITYNGSIRVSEFISIYFHEKYKQKCPMYPIKTYSSFTEDDEFRKIKKIYKNKYTTEELKQHLLETEKGNFIDWNEAKFLKNLKLCLETGEQLIMIPMRVPKHLNLLIIKVATREIIRFEPHGARFKREVDDNNINAFLEKLTVDINSHTY